MEEKEALHKTQGDGGQILMSCMTPICASPLWVSQKDNYSSEFPLFCPNCLMLFHSMRDGGKIENDLAKFYQFVLAKSAKSWKSPLKEIGGFTVTKQDK